MTYTKPAIAVLGSANALIQALKPYSFEPPAGSPGIEQ